MYNQDKFSVFVEIASVLNNELSITPVIYGSLGLSLAISKPMEVNDIDLLVPDELLGDRWEELRQKLENIGFEVKNNEERTMVRNNLTLSFDTYRSLLDVNLTVEDLKSSDINGVRFYELNPYQFLLVYQFSSLKGYRIEHRNDDAKIVMLREYMNELTKV